MSARKPPATLPVATYGHVCNAVSFLRRSGNPADLARTAERLEGAMDLEPYASRPEVLRTAVEVVRHMERWARESLRTVQMWHLEYDFEKAVARVAPRGRGNPETFLSRLTAAAFEELDPEEWYSVQTYGAVREKLAQILDPEDVEALTDTRIRGVIERHVNKRR